MKWVAPRGPGGTEGTSGNPESKHFIRIWVSKP